MKGGGKFGYSIFNPTMWYPDSDLSKGKSEWISAFASHHEKLKQLEREVERCEYLLDESIKKEDYDTAEGLRARLDRLRDTHPIWPVEALLSAAIVSGDFEAARTHHSRLEDVRWNLGLPKFLIGQVLVNRQADFRAVVVSVDLRCEMSDVWLRSALDANALVLELGRRQPFYTLLVDERDDKLAQRELYVHQQNVYSRASRPPVYLPEEALELSHDHSSGFEHDLIEFLFESTVPTPAPAGVQVGLGLRFKPTIKLRLWQRTMAERMRSLGTSSSSL